MVWIGLLDLSGRVDKDCQSISLVDRIEHEVWYRGRQTLGWDIYAGRTRTLDSPDVGSKVPTRTRSREALLGLISFLRRMVDISTSIGKLELKNPTMLASGILGETGELLLRVARSGAGAVVTKSIGLEPREGNLNPTVIELEFGTLNAVGLANPGIQNFRSEIQIAKRGNVPIIGSIFGRDSEEFVKLAERMEEYGADAVELNLSCPHAEGLGQEIGAEPEKVEHITREVKGSVSIPVFPKLTPNVKDIVALAGAAHKGGADAVVAINSVRAMAISPEIGMPILANKIGGLSGPAIRPIGVRCVYEIWKEVSIPVVGVGGVSSGLDALEYIMAGASAVQIGAGVGAGGLRIFSEVCKEIEDFLRGNDYKSIKEIIGVAHSC